MTNSEIREAFTRTIEVVKRGWCQAPYGRVGDRFCLLAAFGESCRPFDHATWKIVSDYVSKHHGVGPIQYNDAKDRTQQEVVELLENILTEGDNLE